MPSTFASSGGGGWCLLLGWFWGGVVRVQNHFFFEFRSGGAVMERCSFQELTFFV